MLFYLQDQSLYHNTENKLANNLSCIRAEFQTLFKVTVFPLKFHQAMSIKIIVEMELERKVIPFPVC